jgi:protein-disulfide isomerase
MMNRVMATSESEMQAVQDVFHGLKLSDFDGENVSDAVGAFRSLTEQLTNNNALPGDVVEIASTMMQATTVGAFKTFVQQQYGYLDSGLQKFQLSGFLDVLEIKYRTMTGVSGKWKAVTTKLNQVSVFFYGKCKYCNKKVHKQVDCWKMKENKGGRAPIAGRGGRDGGPHSRGRG